MADDDATTQTPYVRLGFPKQESLAELYHENTKLQPHLREVEGDPTGAGLEFPEPRSIRFVPPGREGSLRLPDITAEGAVSLDAAILTRRSRRAFTGAPATLDQLAKILHLTYGVTGATEPTGSPGRAAPSAGGRYPLELFVVVRAVDGLAPGVYHYVPEAHELEPVRSGDATPALSFALFDQPFLAKAAFTVVVGAVFTRTLVKYDERGYRLMLLDAGHAMQNLLLAAHAEGLGATALGGFLDDKLNDLVKLNGIDENVLYCASVGRLIDP